MLNILKNIIAVSVILSITNIMIFDFKKDANIPNWKIVDDVVMGGKSQGNFKINNEGNGVFYGNVSLENNGGFSSVKYQFETKSINNYTKIVLRIKGDGNNYQFRIKEDLQHYYSYIKEFSTSTEWENVEIPIFEMYPAFRGRKLNMPNFSGSKIEEIRFLIGNKKEQSFKLEIDKIYFQ